MSGGTTYTFDPVMYVRSALDGSERGCNDDGGSAGAADCHGTGGDAANYGSRVAPTAFASLRRGLHLLYVDSLTGTGGPMTFTVSYLTPN